MNEIDKVILDLCSDCTVPEDAIDYLLDQGYSKRDILNSLDDLIEREQISIEDSQEWFDLLI